MKTLSEPHRVTTGLVAYGELRAVLGYFNRRRADA